MSEDNEEVEAEKPKKKGLLGKLILPLALLAVGGGGSFGLIAAGVINLGESAEEEEDKPKLVLKGDADPYEVPGEDGEGVNYVYGESGSKYRTAYFTFSDEFTSNLHNSDGLIQVTLAASTQYDGRVLMWLKRHELAIRSELLVELANTPEEEIINPEGKQALQKRMVESINRVLTETEGFGGVDHVYFRSLIVQ